MVFEEPKLTFIQVKAEDVIVTSRMAGVETCLNKAPMNNCDADKQHWN